MSEPVEGNEHQGGRSVSEDSDAAAPDAATEWGMSLAELEDIAETHAFCADRLFIETERAEIAEAERDAALAAIERVRAEADAYAEQPDVMEPCGAVAQALRVALDGAPEPDNETEEEMYQARCGSWDCRAPECGRVQR